MMSQCDINLGDFGECVIQEALEILTFWRFDQFRLKWFKCMFSLNITCTWSIEKLESLKNLKEYFIFKFFVVVG